MTSAVGERSAEEEQNTGGVPADAFRLAAEPPRVMRLSRKALAVIGGTASLAIGVAFLWALRPPVPAPPEDLYGVAVKNRSEAVTGAPMDYRALPKLSPPLPNDPGRPIVTAQQDGEALSVPPMAEGLPPDPAANDAEQERQRMRQEREAARASRLFGGASATAAAIELPVAPALPAPHPAADGPAGFQLQGSRPIESSERIRAASSPYVLQTGSVIPAALITGIHSDLPGQIIAQVTQNIYDSPTGRHLLIPQGARLVGEYDSEVAAGQDRVLLAWDRLILPEGRSIRLERQPGADPAGMAGLSDRIDHHWGRVLRAAFVSTLLGAGAELGTGGDDELIRAIREGSQDAFSQTGRRLVEREVGLAPTIRIRPGFAFRVIVTRDLILEPVGAAR